uniref:Uncharacterized protein n=1 Tax=Glossina pallidipes TaxID=7398 RepID=A0A1A9ZSP9_GLOPL
MSNHGGRVTFVGDIVAFHSGIVGLIAVEVMMTSRVAFIHSLFSSSLQLIAKFMPACNIFKM